MTDRTHEDAPSPITRGFDPRLDDPDVICEEIDEGAHTRRLRPTLAEIDGVDVFAVARIEGLEHRMRRPASMSGPIHLPPV